MPTPHPSPNRFFGRVTATSPHLQKLTLLAEIGRSKKLLIKVGTYLTKPMNAYLKVENVDVAIVEEYQFRDKKVCELRRIISLGWAACGYI